jgi:hypothetical protein
VTHGQTAATGASRCDLVAERDNQHHRLSDGASQAGEGAELLVLLCGDAERIGSDAESWATVRVLTLASILLPLLAMPVAFPKMDISRSMRKAVPSVGNGVDHVVVERRIDAAQDMLAWHLVDSYLACSVELEGRWSLDTWLCYAPMSTIVAEMQAAAWFGRLRLLADELGVDGTASYLATTRRWSGADVVERDHPFRAGVLTDRRSLDSRPLDAR